jgi:hypothetical protein
MKDRSTTLLAKPKTRGSNAFKAALDPLKTNPQFRPSRNRRHRLHPGSQRARHLALQRRQGLPDPERHQDRDLARGHAVALRRAKDPRLAHLLDAAAEFDALFSNKKLWEKAKAPKPEMKDPSSIVVWATARTPLTGPILDDVVIGMDEDANLVHQLEPSAIPSDGLRIRRRAMLARSTSGEPVLWTQRQRDLLLAPPTFALRFDVLRQDPPVPQSTS